MNKKKILKTNKKFYRNDKFYNFRGNNKKARKLLNWKPDTNVEKLIEYTRICRSYSKLVLCNKRDFCTFQNPI